MVLFKLLSLLLLQLSPIFASFNDTCRPSSEIISTLENRYQITFSNPSVSFNYDTGNVYIKEFNVRDTELKLLSANVIFAGKIKSKESFKNNEDKINFDTKLITVHRINETVNGKTRCNCRTTHSDNYDLGFDLPTEIEGAVIQLVESCLEIHLCQHFDSIITTNFLQNQRAEESSNRLQPTTVIRPKDDERNRRDCDNAVTNPNAYNSQESINAIIDFAFSVLINNVVTGSNGTVHIPEIHQNFSTGSSFWKATGEVATSAGTFRDLTSLQRVSDIKIENDDHRFSVASTYRLAKAEIKFGYYKVRYGKIKIDGHVAGHINGITLAAKISVDYNARPCRIELENFDLEKIGKVRIDMTGLGILNRQVSKIISYAIKNKTFEHLKKAINDNLHSLDCERFRPKYS